MILIALQNLLFTATSSIHSTTLKCVFRITLRCGLMQSTTSKHSSFVWDLSWSKHASATCHMRLLEWPNYHFSTLKLPFQLREKKNLQFFSSSSWSSLLFYSCLGPSGTFTLTHLLIFLSINAFFFLHVQVPFSLFANTAPKIIIIILFVVGFYPPLIVFCDLVTLLVIYIKQKMI